MKSKNHTTFGHFWTNSQANLQGAPSISRAERLDASQLSALNSQPPVPQPHLWHRQPNEPAADYQLFTAWLELPAPRKFRHAANTLGSSIYRLRRLAAQFDWRSRTAAFDNYRADASSRALDQLLQQEAFDWKDRTEQFRLTEWALHEQILQAASAAADEVRKHPNRVSLTGLLKLYELASALGRRACGMPLKCGDPEPMPEPPSLRPEFEAALNKVYGPPPETAPPAPQSSETLHN